MTVNVLVDVGNMKCSTRLLSHAFVDKDLEGMMGSVSCVVSNRWSMKMECVMDVLRGLDLFVGNVDAGDSLFLLGMIVRDAGIFLELFKLMENVSNAQLATFSTKMIPVLLLHNHHHLLLPHLYLLSHVDQ